MKTKNIVLAIMKKLINTIIMKTLLSFLIMIKECTLNQVMQM